jgi:hypothetical protein
MPRPDIVFVNCGPFGGYFAPSTPLGKKIMHKLNYTLVGWGHYLKKDYSYWVETFLVEGLTLLVCEGTRYFKLTADQFMDMDILPEGRILPKIYKLDPEVDYISIGRV